VPDTFVTNYRQPMWSADNIGQCLLVACHQLNCLSGCFMVIL